MKRFKMGVLNNFQTQKIYATNRKIIYQDIPEKKIQSKTKTKSNTRRKKLKSKPRRKKSRTKRKK